ncbi:MAG: hypothetical protein RIG63_19670 [Coleofasciculus chthonoplastes F3-SA18-01]|uniref:hypothetical protein n=1 Tax=Coleofasciculus chthonoplastes TaxID=64178 RepID=UPI0032F380B7
MRPIFSVKAIVPGMRHFWKRLGSGRLFTVTYEQIEEWATSTIEEENGVIKNPFPSYPYIPCSSC